MAETSIVVVPWQDLAPETLSALLEEIVTRDGTDYGAEEKSTAQKATAAKSRLAGGFAVLVWNPETETASLLGREDAAVLDPSG